MAFLTDEDRIILMNINAEMGGFGLEWVAFDTPGLIRVRDECGVTVVEEQLFWHDVEKEQGKYDWSLPDRHVDRVLKAEMKLMLTAPMTVPGCLPREWYWTEVGGHSHRYGLSFWHQEAQDYQRNFIEKVIERYSGSSVHVICHEFLGGESVMWNVPNFYDVAAVADFEARYGEGKTPVTGPPETSFALSPETKEWLSDAVVRHYLFMQEPFLRQYNEVWDDLQPAIGAQSEANGGYAQYAIHQAYTEKWPDADQWLLMYTYWGNGEWSAGEINKLITDFGCKMIVEAQFCEGLAATTPLAVERDFHGQIVSPLHAYKGHKAMEPWMYESIKKSYIMLRDRETGETIEADSAEK